MNSNLAFTPNSNVVQSPMVFHSAEYSLHRCSTVVDGLPLWSLLSCPFLMMLGCLDNGLRSILSLDVVAKILATIPSVTDNIVRAECADDVASLGEKRSRMANISDISRSDISSDRDFIGGINHKMQLIAPQKLFLAK